MPSFSPHVSRHKPGGDGGGGDGDVHVGQPKQLWNVLQMWVHVWVLERQKPKQAGGGVAGGSDGGGIAGGGIVGGALGGAGESGGGGDDGGATGGGE